MPSHSARALRRAGALLFLPAALLLSAAAAHRPLLVEQLYSGRIYRSLGQALSRATGVFPFSLAELILLLFASAIILSLIAVVRGLRSPERRQFILSAVLIVFFVAGFLCIAFETLWGFNYYRLPFSAIAGLDTSPAGTDELAALVADLAARANTLREQVAEDPDGVAALFGPRAAVPGRAAAAYAAAARQYPALGGRYGRPKMVFLSRLLSYAGIYGFYFPFTGEANINREIPAPELPSTVCHEMAHQRGFAREDEANYLAYVACSLHPDADFRYSGVLLALFNAGNALAVYDPDRYKEIRAGYSAGLRRDIAFINAQNLRFSGPFEDFSSRVNDVYLRANRQPEGVASYGRMVDLLIAERRATIQ